MRVPSGENLVGHGGHQMLRITEPMRTLILQAVKMAGTYDPDEALPAIEEQLTSEQAGIVRDFLSWVHDAGLRFGHGNIDERFEQWAGMEASWRRVGLMEAIPVTLGTDEFLRQGAGTVGTVDANKQSEQRLKKYGR